MINLDSVRERKTIGHYVLSSFYFFSFTQSLLRSFNNHHCRERNGAIVLLDAINARFKLVENVRCARVIKYFSKVCSLNVNLCVFELIVYLHTHDWPKIKTKWSRKSSSPYCIQRSFSKEATPNDSLVERSFHLVWIESEKKNSDWRGISCLHCAAHTRRSAPKKCRTCSFACSLLFFCALSCHHSPFLHVCR